MCINATKNYTTPMTIYKQNLYSSDEVESENYQRVYPYVKIIKKNPYQAHVYFDKLYHIGNYKTIEHASNAYITSMQMNTPVRFSGGY